MEETNTTANNSTNSTSTAEQQPLNIFRSAFRGGMWFGGKVIKTMETIGEAVVSVLGLEESRYQDVLDGMSEEEMARAEEINRQREEEYRIHQQTKQYRIYDTESNIQSSGSEGSFICENVYLREGQVAPPVIAVPFKVEEAIPVPVVIGQECLEASSSPSSPSVPVVAVAEADTTAIEIPLQPLPSASTSQPVPPEVESGSPPSFSLSELPLPIPPPPSSSLSSPSLSQVHGDVV